jgi:hypothetical protein
MAGLISIFNTSPVKQEIDPVNPTFDAQLTREPMLLFRTLASGWAGITAIKRHFYKYIRAIWIASLSMKSRITRFVDWATTNIRIKDDPPESGARKWRP